MGGGGKGEGGREEPARVYFYLVKFLAMGGEGEGSNLSNVIRKEEFCTAISFIIHEGKGGGHN